MKRILTFSDIHNHGGHCRRLVELSAEADLLIGAGDFGVMRHRIVETIEMLSDIDKPTLLVPGNAESESELRAACAQWPSATVLHGEGVELEGLQFYGIGGGIPLTPFGSWSYDFSEKQAQGLLEKYRGGGVLISHSPPNGILDVSSRGDHLGSTAVLEALKAKVPKLLVCGHIHESAGQSQIVGRSTVINAGPRGVFFEWN